MPARARQEHTRNEGIGGAVPGVISGKVNPLGVAKLIAHEVEIGIAYIIKVHLEHSVEQVGVSVTFCGGELVRVAFNDPATVTKYARRARLGGGSQYRWQDFALPRQLFVQCSAFRDMDNCIPKSGA